MPRLAPPVGPAGRLLSLGLAVLATLLGAARGQSAPSTPSAPATSPAAPPGSAAFRSSPVTEIPFCGTVMVTSPKCTFNNLPGNKAQISLARPRATVMDMLSVSVPPPRRRARARGLTPGQTAVHNVPAIRNGLRTLVQGTFPVDPRRPTSYRPNGGPAVTVVGMSGGGTFSRTADLILSREKSILFSAGKTKYRVRVQRGGNNDDIGSLGKGRCTMYIRAACADCPDGQANFGSGCVAATATSAVCPEGQTDLGSGCVDVCLDGQADFGSGSCTPATKESECIRTVDVAFASTPADCECPPLRRRARAWRLTPGQTRSATTTSPR